MVSSLLYLFSTTILIIFITLPTSYGTLDKYYKTCSSIKRPSCGKIQNIGYPFWGPDIGRPQFCGHAALRLNCPSNTSHDHPVLELYGRDYDASFGVLGISISHLNVTTIELEAISNDNSTCLLQNFIRTDMPDIFSGSFNMSNYFLNCPPQTKPEVPALRSCFNNQTNFTAYYMHDHPDHYKSLNCEPLEVPLPWRLAGILNHGNQTLLISKVLMQSFSVNFDYSSHCSLCEQTGGACGSSNGSEFMCYCREGPSSTVCRISGNTRPHKKGKLRTIVGVAVPVGFFILVALNIGIWYCLKHKIRRPVSLARMISSDPRKSDLESGSSFNGILVFSYSELQEATKNFDEAQELGDGGFGIVYYGKLRDGREVAVKRLYEKNYKRVAQFKNEVELLTHLRHQHLVTLYGCSSRHSRELLLVYEYVPNGTVADHLYGERSGSGTLTWAIRMKIALETASALSYLHTSDIVHRDVKTNNILLDNNFTVKLADFGLSRLFPFDVTHVSTAPQGTPGYLDPQYHKCYQVTSKSDVYSFGVVLVELISSLPAVDISRHGNEINLSDYAMSRIQRGALNQLVDQNLGYESNFRVRRMITLVAELAFQCLQQEKEVRPCMTEVHSSLIQIDNLDYKKLEEEYMNVTLSKSEPDSIVADNDVEQKPPPSPSSVINNWAMKSSESSTTS